MAIRVHLIGAHETNHPWGFENRLIPALLAAGHDVVATDYRRRRAELPRLIRTPADLVLVCKGEHIPSELVASAPGRRALWYAEQIGTASATDPLADGRRRELALNVAAFDVVFSHDAANLDVFRALGARSVHWLPTACVAPEIHRPLHTTQVHDVTFVGTLTDRRRALLARLSQHLEVNVTNEWDPVRLNVLFNRSRVVLNLHLSDLPNTETRVAEVLGAGACLVTEALSSPGLLEPGRHALVVPQGDVDALTGAVSGALSTPARRAALAAAGHAHALSRHTFAHRVRTLVELALDVRQPA